jgi:3-hydroxyisobutyrate dehydrogenase
MLRNLVTKGFAVLAYDVQPAALEGAARLGATPAGSAAAAAAQSDLVVTMLPSASHVETAYLGPQGILEGLASGRLCVDMSTIDPATSQRVAARLRTRGVRFIDAPVSGGVAGAEDGTLAIMVGGDAADLEEARPVLDAMGKHVVHVGAVGAGEVAKLCNNLIAGVCTVAVSEAFRIAEGFGVDARVLTDVIASSSGRTWIRSPASCPGRRRAATTRRGSRSTSCARTSGWRSTPLASCASPSRCRRPRSRFCAWRPRRGTGTRTSRRSTRS